MPRTTMTRALLVALALLPGGCGARLSGTWAEASGQGQLQFESDGTAWLTTFGGTIACSYEIDGDHVLLRGPNGTVVLTRRGDTLQGGLGCSYVDLRRAHSSASPSSAPAPVSAIPVRRPGGS
jgi:hypothetical protein